MHVWGGCVWPVQVLRQQARAGVTVAPGLSYVPGMVGISYDEQPAPVDAASDAEVSPCMMMHEG
jgi:hypothetical protein